MKKKVWTAISGPFLGIVLYAQGKSSRSDLWRALMRDDPLWLRGLRWELRPSLSKGSRISTDLWIKAVSLQK